MVPINESFFFIFGHCSALGRQGWKWGPPHGVSHRLSLVSWCATVARHAPQIKAFGGWNYSAQFAFLPFRRHGWWPVLTQPFHSLFSGALLLVLPVLSGPLHLREDTDTHGRKGRHSTDTAKEKAPPQGRAAGSPLRRFWGGSNPAAYFSKIRQPVKDTPNSSFSRIFK